ncbi:peptidyl serine alpha-galactosyltransferase [Wolffia australiana]
MAPAKKFLLFIALAPLIAVVVQGAVEGEMGFRLHTLFSTECQNYFDWQTVGMMHSFRKARQPGRITRLLSCTDEDQRDYRGMDLAPTLHVPSMSRHPRTGDWYPAINKPAGIVHWLKHSEDAKNTDWVVILDADMIIRGPIIPWEIGAEKGKPVAALYGYLIGCDNILAKLHTKHPERCDKVGGLLAMHIDDLRALAPFWLSKTEEVREDREHWALNITGDIYEKGWISEMYGYSFGAAEVGLRHKITNKLMIYPGYTPEEGVEPILMHYGLPFQVGNLSFAKLAYHDDAIVYDCNRLFPEPPYPREVHLMERDSNKRRGLLLMLECMNTLNEALMLHHESVGCPKPKLSKYTRFLKSKTFADLVKPIYLSSAEKGSTTFERKQITLTKKETSYPKIHTVFSTECSTYFDWQTLGLMYSYSLSGQPGGITRLLSCTDEELKKYKGHDLAPTHYVPSMSRHPLTGDWYPAINKPAGVLHWLNHVTTDAEFIVILDADMIMRGPITPWEFNAERGRPVSAPYEYLIGCDNILAKIHTSHPEACDKVGGVIIMHIDDLREFALLWLHKTEEVRADKAHYATNYTGDIYSSGWISEMYGYSFGAAELKLRHLVNHDIMIYPGYVPSLNVDYRVFHYGLEFRVGNWSFDKADWRETDVVNTCWAKFPEPPDPSSLSREDEDALRRDLLSIECVQKLNTALNLYHQKTCRKDEESSESAEHSRKWLGETKGEKLDNLKQRNQLSDEESSESAERSRKWLGETRGDKVGNLKERKRLSKFSSVRAKIVSGSQRSWLVGIWAFSVMSFLVGISITLSRQQRDGTRNKADKDKV